MMKQQQNMRKKIQLSNKKKKRNQTKSLVRISPSPRVTVAMKQGSGGIPTESGYRPHVIRGIGSPQEIVMTFKVGYTAGGGGGAVGAVTNEFWLNDFSSTGTSWSPSDEEPDMINAAYEWSRVLRVHSFKVTASNKAASATTCGIIFSATSTTLVSNTVQGILKECDTRFGKVFTIGPASSGMPIKTVRLPASNLAGIIGPSYLTDDQYAGNNTTIASGIPATKVYGYFFAAPTAGGNFTASTDPIFILTALVDVMGFRKRTS